MFYHGSKIPGIKILYPSFSLHDKEYVYLTTNRSVALIYTVNAIESFYEEKQLVKPEKFQAWYSYGFDQERIPVLEEYYPNATEETYAGKSGYIYVCKSPIESSNPTNIYCAVVTEENVKVKDEIFVEDVFQELLEQEKLGLIHIRRYSEMTQAYLDNIHKMLRADVAKYNLFDQPDNDYSVFLKEKFPFLFA